MNSKHIFKRLFQSLLLILFFWISIFTYATWFWELMYRGDGEYEATYEGFIFQNYRLTFPDISLSESATYTYTAAGLKTHGNPNVVFLMKNVDDFDIANLDVELTLRIRDSSGKLFYEVRGPLVAGITCGMNYDERPKFHETNPIYWLAMTCGRDSKLASTHSSIVIGYRNELDWSWWEKYSFEVTVDQPSRRYAKLVGTLQISSGWK